MESEYSEVPPTGREPSTEDLQIKIERLQEIVQRPFEGNLDAKHPFGRRSGLIKR